MAFPKNRYRKQAVPLSKTGNCLYTLICIYNSNFSSASAAHQSQPQSSHLSKAGLKA